MLTNKRQQCIHLNMTWRRILVVLQHSLCSTKQSDRGRNKTVREDSWTSGPIVFYCNLVKTAIMDLIPSHGKVSNFSCSLKLTQAGRCNKLCAYMCTHIHTHTHTNKQTHTHTNTLNLTSNLAAVVLHEGGSHVDMVLWAFVFSGTLEHQACWLDTFCSAGKLHVVDVGLPTSCKTKNY